MPRLVRLGMLSALSQALLKVASPGVPDYYQGTELWDFSLVDPDNRRPVDFGVRRQYLGEKEEARALLEALPDGRAKLHVIRKGLELRKELPRVFHEGSYQALHADAGMEEKVCAFALQHAGAKVIAIAPRLFAALLGEGDAAPIGGAVWKDSRLVLPEGRGRGVEEVDGRIVLSDEGVGRVFLNPGQDLFPASGGVSAIDAPAGQIDDDVASIDDALPAAKRRSVPRNHAPRPGASAAAQDDDVITASVKRPGKNRPDLSGSSWNDDLHDSPLG